MCVYTKDAVPYHVDTVNAKENTVHTSKDAVGAFLLFTLFISHVDTVDTKENTYTHFCS